MQYGAIYHEDCELPEFQEMKERWPQAANHDQLHINFADVHEDTEDPTLIPEGLTEDQEVWFVAQQMVLGNNKTLVIWLTRPQLKRLYRNPAWKLWCGVYEEGKTHDQDWGYVKGVVHEYFPHLDNLCPDKLDLKDSRDKIIELVTKAQS